MRIQFSGTPEPVGDGTALPPFFTAFLTFENGHAAEIDVVVEDGAPLVDAVRFKRNPSSGPITRDDIRGFPLGAWFSHAVQAAAWRPGDEPGQWEFDYRESDEPLPGQRRRRAVTPALLREVSSVYRAASKYPAKAVEEHFDTTPRTASRWIKKAKADGYLDGSDA
jgi:hypothetical protein